MREYELTVVLHPDLETDLETPLKKVRGIVTDNGGKIVKEDNWGKKRLAYRINKEDFGVYVYFDVELPAEAVAKVNATLNITDEALRFLLVSVDPKARAAAEEAAKAKNEEE
jgi:small subunit ribosomal protein S6